MRKKIAGLCLVSIFFLMLALPAYASNPPTIDPYPEVIDAETILISGTAEANAYITVVGGPYDLPNYQADDKGKFQITLALIQDATNVYLIGAIGADGKKSSDVTITIQESAEEAKKLEEEEGKDLTAPEKPTINAVTSPIDADSYVIKGKAEPMSTIRVTGDDEVTVKTKSNGQFSVEVFLKQNKENTFKLAAMDKAGNISANVSITIVEEGAAKESDNEGDNGEPEEEPANPEDIFPDIKGHWAVDYIYQLYTLNVIDGYEDGTFGPNDNITRAGLTKVALLSFEYEVSPRVEKPPFSDVAIDTWFAKFVQDAKERNIVDGYDDGTFKPLENISRAAALKILLEASGLDLSKVDVNNNFPDVDGSVWFAKYTAYSKKYGIIGGYAEDGSFRAGNFITRAEVTKIAMKLIEHKKEIAATPTI